MSRVCEAPFPPSKHGRGGHDMEVEGMIFFVEEHHLTVFGAERGGRKARNQLPQTVCYPQTARP